MGARGERRGLDTTVPASQRGIGRDRVNQRLEQSVGQYVIPILSASRLHVRELSSPAIGSRENVREVGSPPIGHVPGDRPSRLSASDGLV